MAGLSRSMFSKIRVYLVRGRVRVRVTVRVRVRVKVKVRVRVRVRVVEEHVLEDTRVPAQRQRLVLVTKVPVVRAG